MTAIFKNAVNLQNHVSCPFPVSSDVVRYDLKPLLQGQTRIAKLKSAYNLLIIGPRVLRCEIDL